jgi:hypothetical protein
MKTVKFTLSYEVSWEDDEAPKTNTALLSEALEVFAHASYKEIGENVIVESAEILEE